MKLSIIIPAYNCENYILKCLTSIYENIDRKSVEVILINDGSNDNTENVIKNSHYFSDLVFVSNTNMGVSHARNVGIEKATGDYLMFVDADDYLDQNWSKIVFNVISEHKNYDIIYFNEKIDIKNIYNYIIGNNKENVCIGGVVSRLFKTSFVKKNHLKFNETLFIGEDMIFNLNAVTLSKNIISIPKIFYYYRQNLGSITKTFNDKIFENDITFHNELNKILINSKLSQENVENIKNFCLCNAIITIYNRISYIDNYKNTREKLRKLYDLPYSNISLIIGVKIIKNNKNKLKFLVYKLRLKYLLFIMFKLSHAKKYSSTETFIKI